MTACDRHVEPGSQLVPALRGTDGLADGPLGRFPRVWRLESFNERPPFVQARFPRHRQWSGAKKRLREHPLRSRIRQRKIVPRLRWRPASLSSHLLPVGRSRPSRTPATPPLAGPPSSGTRPSPTSAARLFRFTHFAARFRTNPRRSPRSPACRRASSAGRPPAPPAVGIAVAGVGAQALWWRDQLPDPAARSGKRCLQLRQPPPFRHRRHHLQPGSGRRNGRAPAQQFVQDDADRPHVRLRADELGPPGRLPPGPCTPGVPEHVWPCASGSLPRPRFRQPRSRSLLGVAVGGRGARWPASGRGGRCPRAWGGVPPRRRSWPTRVGPCGGNRSRSAGLLGLC